MTNTKHDTPATAPRQAGERANNHLITARILAGLRALQERIEASSHAPLMDIAMASERYAEPTMAELDALCIAINCGDPYLETWTPFQCARR